MRRLLIILLFVPLLGFGQTSDASLTSQSNVIRNETVSGANTRARVADMFQGLVDSKLSRTDDSELEALSSLSTFGYLVHVSGNTWATRTFQNGNGIIVNNGNGVSGNTSFDLGDFSSNITMDGGSSSFTMTGSGAKLLLSPDGTANHSSGVAITSSSVSLVEGVLGSRRSININPASNGISIIDQEHEKGLVGDADYSSNYDANTYTQKVYVDARALSGTYTPTLTNVANLDGSTAFQCQYTRVGDVVTVSGKVTVDPTTTLTSTQLGISLPIASNLGAQEDCAGASFCPTISGEGAAILGDSANNRAEVRFQATNTTSYDLFFTFVYEVI